MAIWWLAAIVLLAGGAPQKAPPEMLGFFDAAALNEFCTTEGPLAPDARIICLSYITGAVDQLLAQQALDAPANHTICVPQDIAAASLMGEVTAYAGWSKTAKGVSAANFVKYAMEKAYPCNAFDGEAM
jgi:hypothetical protein